LFCAGSSGAVGALACALALVLLQASAARAQASTAVNACVAAHTEAQRLRMAGKLLAAREQLLACAQRECPALVANDCALWLPELEAELPSVVLAVEDASGRDLIAVRVFANDRLLTERTEGHAVALDPGSYRFRFEVAGYRPLTVTASVRQAEKNRLVRARLEPVAPNAAAESGDELASEGADSVPVASWVLGGVALASMGAFTYFAVSGKQEHNRLSESCGQSCTDAQVADGKRAYIIADVALGVGVASAAAAVILLFTSGEAAPAPEAGARAGLQVGVSPDGGSVHWTSRH
jgi:hypothetical protein